MVVNPFDIEGTFIQSPSTNFDYSRDIYSAYATFSKSLGEIQPSNWVRAENVKGDRRYGKESYEAVVTDDLTYINTDPEVAVTTEGDKVFQKFTNDYFQLYPSAFFTYTPSEKISFR